MKLFHLSMDIDKNIESFIPRIPSSALPIEDVTIPRVCLCSSIEDCFNAMGYIKNYEYSKTYNKEITNYAIVRVYEFEVEKNKLLKSEDIVQYVPDALLTREYWSLEEVKPISSYLILPTYFYQEDKYPNYIIDFEYENEEWIKENL